MLYIVQVMIFLLKVKRAKYVLDKARRWMWKVSVSVLPALFHAIRNIGVQLAGCISIDKCYCKTIHGTFSHLSSSFLNFPSFRIGE